MNFIFYSLTFVIHFHQMFDTFKCNNVRTKQHNHNMRGLGVAAAIQHKCERTNVVQKGSIPGDGTHLLMTHNLVGSSHKGVSVPMCEFGVNYGWPDQFARKAKCHTLRLKTFWCHTSVHTTSLKSSTQMSHQAMHQEII